MWGSDRSDGAGTSHLSHHLGPLSPLQTQQQQNYLAEYSRNCKTIVNGCAFKLVSYGVVLFVHLLLLYFFFTAVVN